jgi:ferric-dicitrate binding protein FerR (iron transport regulator)
MSDKQPLSRLATDALAAEGARSSPEASAPPRPEDEVRIIRTIEAEIRAVARRRRIRRVIAASVVAVAAGIALFVAFPGRGTSEPSAQSLADGVVIVRSGSQLPVDTKTPMRAGDRMVTTSTGRGSVLFATGTQVVVEGASELVIVEPGPVYAFSLAAGTMRANVAKLKPGERFVVRTADGEIEVRGTTFEVSIVPPSLCANGSKTHLAVAEGTVAVRTSRGEELVTKGQVWPADCATEAAPLPMPTAPLVASATSDGSLAPITSSSAASTSATEPKPTGSAPAPRVPSTVAAASDLGAQNALFAEATAARRRGDDTAALAAYDRLRAQYPQSPLSETADTERMRLLAASNPRRGAEAARAYLARYPRGFARAEAAAIAARAP